MTDVVTNARAYLAQAGEPCWNEACVGYAATEHIVALIEAYERDVPQWVSVEDVPPKMGGYYLMSRRGSVLLAMWATDWYIGDRIVESSGSYYMPLPSAPVPARGWYHGVRIEEVSDDNND